MVLCVGHIIKSEGFSTFYFQSLTEVLDGGAVIAENRDDTGPEDLQGGDVGRKDAECTRERRHIHLFNTGLLEEHLRRRDSLIFSEKCSLQHMIANGQIAEFAVELRTDGSTAQ